MWENTAFPKKNSKLNLVTAEVAFENYDYLYKLYC